MGHLPPFDWWWVYIRCQITWSWLYSAITTSRWWFIVPHKKDIFIRHLFNWLNASVFLRKLFITWPFIKILISISISKELIKVVGWASFIYRPARSPVKMYLLVQSIWGRAWFSTKSEVRRMLLVRRPHALGSKAPAIALARLNCEYFKLPFRSPSMHDPYLHVLLPS